MPHKRQKRSVRESDKAKKGSDLPPQTLSGPSSSYSDADTPKAGARILNSLKVQAAYRERRKISSEDLGPAGRSKGKNGGKKAIETPKILPGETLGQFNRRLEDHLRPAVTAAMKDAASRQAQEEREIWQAKKARREAAKEAKRAKDAGEEVEVDGPVASGSGSKQVGAKPVGDLKGDKKRKRPTEDSEEEADRTSNKPQKEFAPIPAPRRLNDIAMAPPSLPSLRKSQTKAAPGAFAPTGRTPLSQGQQRLMEEERERVIQRYREMKESKRVEREEEEKQKLKRGKAGKAVGKKAMMEVDDTVEEVPLDR